MENYTLSFNLINKLYNNTIIQYNIIYLEYPMLVISIKKFSIGKYKDSINQYLIRSLVNTFNYLPIE